MHSDKKLNLLQLTVIVTGNMMGPGLFLMPSNLAAIGSVAILGWILTAAGAMVLALMFARLGFLYPGNSGLYTFSHQGLGRFAGFQVVYGYWFSIWTGNVAAALAATGYLSYFFPALHDPFHGCLAAIGLIWLLSLFNSSGLRVIGWFQVVTTSCMLAPVLLILGFGWMKADPSRLMEATNVSGGSLFDAITDAASLTLWTFIGLESACNASVVSENPRRNVPIATLLGTGVAATAYILCTSMVMMLVPNEMLQETSAPLSLAAKTLFGDLAGSLVSGCAFIACIGSLNGWIMMQGLVARMAARDHLFPRIFARVNRHQAPVFGLFIAAILMSGMLFLTLSPTLNSQFQTMALLCVFGTLLTYVYSVASALVILRRSSFETEYRRGLYLLAFMALIYCFWAALGAGKEVLYYGAVAMLFSAVLYGWTQQQELAVQESMGPPSDNDPDSASKSDMSASRMMGDAGGCQ
ncbi:amino acid permease [Endozoicomonadaceae bacterium StTr2]